MARFAGPIRKKLRRFYQRMIHETLGLLLRLLLILFRILPFPAAQGFGRMLGSLTGCLLPRQRNLVAEQLRFAFGSKYTDAEYNRLEKRVFEHFGISLMEMLKLANMRRKELLDMVDGKGVEKLLKTAQSGQGMVFVGSHTGNWEFLGAWLAYQGLQINVVARENPIDRVGSILLRIRNRSGLQSIPRDTPDMGKKVIQALKSGAAVGLLIDQDSRRMKGVFADFLGHPAHTPVGPAVLALRYKIPVFYCFTARRQDGRHGIVCEGPAEIIRTGDFRADVIANTYRFNQRISRWIEDHPEQWVWVHRRWQTRPAHEVKGEE